MVSWNEAEALSRRADDVMAELGFTRPYDDELVSELHLLVLDKVERGGLKRWRASFLPGVSQRDRARALLATEWAIKNGLTHETRCLDPIVRRVYRLDRISGREFRTWRVSWKRIPDKVLDVIDESAFLARKFWIERVLKRRNPYSGQS